MIRGTIEISQAEGCITRYLGEHYFVAKPSVGEKVSIDDRIFVITDIIHCCNNLQDSIHTESYLRVLVKKD